MKYKNINKQYFLLKSDAGVTILLQMGGQGRPTPDPHPNFHTHSQTCAKSI